MDNQELQEPIMATGQLAERRPDLDATVLGVVAAVWIVPAGIFLALMLA